MEEKRRWEGRVGAVKGEGNCSQNGMYEKIDFKRMKRISQHCEHQVYRKVFFVCEIDSNASAVDLRVGEQLKKVQ